MTDRHAARSVKVPINFTPDEKDRLRALAERNSRSLSSLLRLHSLTLLATPDAAPTLSLRQSPFDHQHGPVTFTTGDAAT